MVSDTLITQNVLAALPEVDLSKFSNDGTFTLSNGIRFKIKNVPPFLMMDARQNVKEPKPPLVPNLDKDPNGSVLEENLNDPTYIQQMEDYRRTIGEVSAAVMFTRGTELVHVPEGIDRPESTDWAEDALEFAGLKVPEFGRRRYYCWLKYVALESSADFNNLFAAVSTKAGQVQEVAVANATDDFRREPERDTAPPVRAEEANGRGPGDNGINSWNGPGV